MIVLDSSALLAIAFAEPEKEAFEDIIAGARRTRDRALRVHARDGKVQQIRKLPMHEPSALTVRLKPEIERKLATLSERTQRTAAALAADAIASYVERESAILDGIARGLDDMRAGRLVPHDEAMDELDAAIAAAGQMRR